MNGLTQFIYELTNLLNYLEKLEWSLKYNQLDKKNFKQIHKNTQIL